jgi:hydroxymethylbilane synthase
MESKIRIGTRASKLAMWQTEFVAGLLNNAGYETEILKIETKGDKQLTSTFSEIGTKGIFTEELELQLKDGSLDIAVHSAKDMQTDLGPELEIIAFTEREKPNDVLVSFDKSFALEDLSRVLVGTSSTRRKALLKHYYPHLSTTDARGNLQTRLKKMEDGLFPAMILAFAGMHRMGYNDFIVKELPVDVFTPAVGQGSIAIEAASSLASDKKDVIRKLLNHIPTETCLIGERAFLNRLEGGCSIPVFGLGTIEGNLLKLRGGVVSPDGSEIVRKEIVGSQTDARKLGLQLAEEVLNSGGKEILNALKK